MYDYDPNKFWIEDAFGNYMESHDKWAKNPEHKDSPEYQGNSRRLFNAMADEWANTLEGQRLLGPDFPTERYRTSRDFARASAFPEFQIYKNVRLYQLWQQFNQEAAGWHANVKRIQ